MVRRTRQLDQVIVEVLSIAAGRGAVVSLNEDVLAILPGIPGPTQIAEAMLIRPGQEGGVIGRGSADIVPGLAGHHGYLPGQGGHHAIPAGFVGASLPGIAVPRYSQVVDGVDGGIGEPLRDIIGPIQSGHQDQIAGTGGPNDIDQRLHACRAPDVPMRVWIPSRKVLVQRAAQEPAVPQVLRRVLQIACVEKRLVVEVKHDILIPLEGPCNGAPEGQGVVLIRHGLLRSRGNRPGSTPVKVQDHIETGPVKSRDETLD